MADVEKLVKVVFSGDDQISRVIDAIDNRMSGMSGKIGDMAAPFASMADGVLAVDAALTALAVGGFVVAIQKSGEFHTGLAEINTLAGMNEDQFQRFGNSVLQYGQNSTQAIDKINGALYQAISLGVDWEHSVEAVNVAERLAVGGRADLVQSTELLLGAMNAYGAGMDQATRFSDTFFTIVKDGKTTIPELSQSLSQVTGIASAGKIPIETLGAAIAAVTASGVPTAQAMTQIKSVIEGIINPTSAASKAADALGISFGANALEAKGLDGVLREIYKATGGNVEKMTQLFTSTEALQGALVLGADKSGIFARALQDMGSKSGATERAFGEMENNLNLTWQNMVNNANVAFVKMGEQIQGSGSGIVSEVGQIFRGLSISIDEGAFDSLFDVLNEVGADVRSTLRGMADALPEAFAMVDFSNMQSALRGVASAFGDFLNGIDLTKPEDLSRVIQFVTDSVTSLINVSRGMIESFRPVFSTIVSAIDSFNNLDSSTQEASGNILGIAKTIDSLLPALGAMGSALTASAHALNALAFNQAASGIRTLIGFLGGSGGLSVAASSAALAFAPFAIGGAIGAGIPWLVDKIDSLVSATEEIPVDKTVEVMVDGSMVKKNVDDVLLDLQDMKANLQATLEIKDSGHGPITATQLKEMLDAGMSDAEIQYKITGDPRYLQAALTEAGVKIVESQEETKNKVQQIWSGDWWIDAAGNRHEVMVDVVPKNLDETKKKIEEIPTEKRLEMMLQGDIDARLATIKTDAEIIQSKIEWKAKVDIADAEAQTKRLETAFESVSDGIKSTGDLLSGLFDNLEGATTSEKWAIQSAIEKEQTRRDQAFDLQRELTQQQTDYMKIKNEQLKRGDAAIKVSIDGVYPELEIVLQKLIERAQIMAAQEGLEALLGVP